MSKFSFQTTSYKGFYIHTHCETMGTFTEDVVKVTDKWGNKFPAKTFLGAKRLITKMATAA